MNQDYWEERYQTAGEWATVCTRDADASDYFRRAYYEYNEVAPLIATWSPRRVLDYGCGTGRFVPFLMAHATNYLGLDLSPTAIRIAKRRFADQRIRFRPSKELRRITPHSIDLIWTFTVLQHITEASRVEGIFRQFARVMAKGARIVITELTTGESDEPHMAIRASDWNELVAKEAGLQTCVDPRQTEQGLTRMIFWSEVGLL